MFSLKLRVDKSLHIHIENGNEGSFNVSQTFAKEVPTSRANPGEAFSNGF